MELQLLWKQPGRTFQSWLLGGIFLTKEHTKELGRRQLYNLQMLPVDWPKSPQSRTSKLHGQGLCFQLLWALVPGLWRCLKRTWCGGIIYELYHCGFWVFAFEPQCSSSEQYIRNVLVHSHGSSSCGNKVLSVTFQQQSQQGKKR